LVKENWTDAVAVGDSTPKHITIEVVKPLQIKATGYGHQKKSEVRSQKSEVKR
jgi:hypothetical protein